LWIWIWHGGVSYIFFFLVVELSAASNERRRGRRGILFFVICSTLISILECGWETCGSVQRGTSDHDVFRQI
jgi:hypothetical protein